jgi:hypothetical protein
VCEYTYGKGYRFKGLPCDKNGNYVFDGNTMISAINKMMEKGDIDSFCRHLLIYEKYSVFIPDLCYTTEKQRYYINIELMQPDRFFQLMGEWLEREEGK